MHHFLVQALKLSCISFQFKDSSLDSSSVCISSPQTNVDNQNFSLIQKFLLYCHPASPLFKSMKSIVSCNVMHLLTGCMLLPLYNSYPPTNFQISLLILFHKPEQRGSGNLGCKVATLVYQTDKISREYEDILKNTCTLYANHYVCSFKNVYTIHIIFVQTKSAPGVERKFGFVPYLSIWIVS